VNAVSRAITRQEARMIQGVLAIRTGFDTDAVERRTGRGSVLTYACLGRRWQTSFLYGALLAAILNGTPSSLRQGMRTTA